MDFQTCAVELVQIQFHEAVAAFVSGTLDNCPSDLLACYVQSLWNITMKNVPITSHDKSKEMQNVQELRDTSLR